MAHKRRASETGSIYKRGQRWWIAFRDMSGQQVFESSKSAKYDDAERLLQQRLGEVQHETFAGSNAKRLRFEQLAEAVRETYANKGNRSTPRMERALKALSASFAGMKLVHLTTRRIAEYVTARREAGLAQSTIKYELAILRVGFSTLKKKGELGTVPAIPALKVSNTRTKWFQADQLEALCKALPPYLAPVARFAYLTGWRKQEILGLTWDRVDFREGWVWLDPGTTKNGLGRQFPFTVLPELETLLRDQRRDTEVIASVIGREIPWVFHRQGQRIRDHYHAFRVATAAIGAPWLILHDFRRSAVRNLIRAGVAQTVAMKLTGHETPAIFARYNIVEEADLRAAVGKLAASRDDDLMTIGKNGGTP